MRNWLIKKFGGYTESQLNVNKVVNYDQGFEDGHHKCKLRRIEQVQVGFINPAIRNGEYTIDGNPVVILDKNDRRKRITQ